MSEIKILYGYKELVEQPPTIREVKTSRLLWFDKIEYYIDFEFLSIGPYSNINEALAHIGMYNAHTRRKRTYNPR